MRCSPISGARRSPRASVGTLRESSAIGRARAKLERKHLDLCVLNAPSAMGGDDATVLVVDPGGLLETIGPAPKGQVAARLVELGFELWNRRQEAAS